MFTAFRGIFVSVLVLLSMSGFADDQVEFNRDIRPILSNHCFACHGPDSATREAELRLDQRESSTIKAESGEIPIVPGEPRRSEMIRRITSHDPDDRMPPADGGKRLNQQQVAILARWIEQGAEYQPHWSFIAPKRQSPPRTDSSWLKNDIDRFVLQRLEHEKRKPAREASRETLIRRVAFDLTGLPPTIKEIDRFLADKSTRAYEHMVDRYLKSPGYGEHMARHWLDVARYADTNGYQYDTERQQWVWRDWVIDAYNRNMPFDQFTTDQLAGDLLPDATSQQRLATGFNRNHGITIEGGVIDEEYRTEYVMDRLVTTSAVWMGLTVGCARCHDHKFDPISQKEFYQLYAFFNQVPERGMGFAPKERISSPLAASQNKQLDEQLVELRAKLNEPVEIESHLDAWAQQVAASATGGWQILVPKTMTSSGKSNMQKLDDNSIVVGGANPRADVYDISATTKALNVTAIRLEALTHESLPGGGPGRHSNSNFVLSEFEMTAVSVKEPKTTQTVKFAKAIADYSQANYEIAKAIDGASGNSGWAVDGPTRKKKATAIFIASEPFGFEGGTKVQFRMRHEASFATHGVGRPRFSVTTDDPDNLSFGGISAEIRTIATMPKAKRTPQQTADLKQYFLKHHDPRQKLKTRIADLQNKKNAAFPETLIMKDGTFRKTRILNRGQYDEPADEVTATVPAVFPTMPKDSPPNRLGLARWLVDRNHPLTARVAVNRYWQRLFGAGLVKTSEDFGVQGELPSHPELLDWLADEFVRSGWDVKHMQRLIITSATYRQTSHVSPNDYRTDPENRLLARGPRMRLDGEEIRDAALSVSGLLVNRIGGKGVYPYQPKGLWMELNNRPGYSKEYPQGQNEALYRRSMYTFWKRTVPSPMMKTFDAPERELCTIKRSRTNTPLQALLLLNGPQFVEAARHLGERMMLEGGDTIEQRVEYGFRLLTARRPTATELDVFVEAFESELKHCSEQPKRVDRLLNVGDSAPNTKLDRKQLAAFTTVARLMLNLNEAITKG